MKIIDPSFEIQDRLDQASLVIRLEECGRICYKSEELITEESALPFVSKIAAHGHNSVLEMAAVTLKIRADAEAMTELLACQPKYLFIDSYEDGFLVTGSIRSFREINGQHNKVHLVSVMVNHLANRHPYLFEGVWAKDTARETDPRIKVEKVDIADIEKLPQPLLLRHRHVGVKFFVNRAVTHELVRHRPCSFLQESQRYCRYGQDKFDNQVTFIKPMFYKEGSEEYRMWVQAMEETESIYLKLLETSSPQAARTVLPNSCKTEIIVYCNLAEWRHIFDLRTSQAAEPSMREIMIPLQEEMEKRYPAMG